jgi:hypothetical protein
MLQVEQLFIDDAPRRQTVEELMGCTMGVRKII